MSTPNVGPHLHEDLSATAHVIADDLLGSRHWQTRDLVARLVDMMLWHGISPDDIFDWFEIGAESPHVDSNPVICPP